MSCPRTQHNYLKPVSNPDRLIRLHSVLHHVNCCGRSSVGFFSAAIQVFLTYLSLISVYRLPPASYLHVLYVSSWLNGFRHLTLLLYNLSEWRARFEITVFFRVQPPLQTKQINTTWNGLVNGEAISLTHVCVSLALLSPGKFAV